MANKKVLTNTLAQIAGKIATAGISIFLIKILTNYLGVDGYGLYSKIYTYLSIFSVIADLGLYTMSVREMTKYQGDPKRLRVISGTIMSLRAIFGVGIIAVSLFVALLLPGYHSTVALLGVAIVGVFTFFGLLNSSVLCVLQAFLKTEFSFYSVTVGKIVGFLGVVLTAYALIPGPLSGDLLIASLSRADVALLLVFAAGLAGNIVMTTILWIYTARITPIGFAWDGGYARELLRATLPYGLALFLGVIFFKVDVILLSLLEPLGLQSWQW